MKSLRNHHHVSLLKRIKPALCFALAIGLALPCQGGTGTKVAAGGLAAGAVAITTGTVVYAGVAGGPVGIGALGATEGAAILVAALGFFWPDQGPPPQFPPFPFVPQPVWERPTLLGTVNFADASLTGTSADAMITASNDFNRSVNDLLMNYRGGMTDAQYATNLQAISDRGYALADAVDAYGLTHQFTQSDLDQGRLLLQADGLPPGELTVLRASGWTTADLADFVQYQLANPATLHPGAASVSLGDTIRAFAYGVQPITVPEPMLGLLGVASAMVVRRRRS